MLLSQHSLIQWYLRYVHDSDCTITRYCNFPAIHWHATEAIHCTTLKSRYKRSSYCIWWPRSDRVTKGYWTAVVWSHFLYWPRPSLQQHRTYYSCSYRVEEQAAKLQELQGSLIIMRFGVITCLFRHHSCSEKIRHSLQLEHLLGKSKAYVGVSKRMAQCSPCHT